MKKLINRTRKRNQLNQDRKKIAKKKKQKRKDQVIPVFCYQCPSGDGRSIHQRCERQGLVLPLPFL